MKTISNLKTDIQNAIVSLIAQENKMNQDYKKTERLIMEILNSSKGLISIDANDIGEFFQRGEEIHALDVSVNAASDSRMKQLMEKITGNAMSRKPYNRCLVFFFLPENHPMMLEELLPFSNWIETISGELMIKWGMTTHPLQSLRAIVLLQ
jgi:hypothetical protein